MSVVAATSNELVPEGMNPLIAETPLAPVVFEYTKRHRRGAQAMTDPTIETKPNTANMPI